MACGQSEKKGGIGMLGLVWACWMHVPRGFFGIQCWSLRSRFPVIIPDAPVQLLGRDGACPLWVWPSQNLILNPVGSYSLDLGDGPAFLGLGIPDIQHSLAFSAVENRSEVGNFPGCQLCWE